MGDLGFGLFQLVVFIRFSAVLMTNEFCGGVKCVS